MFPGIRQLINGSTARAHVIVSMQQINLKYEVRRTSILNRHLLIIFLF